MTLMEYQLEICAADIDSVHAAARGGADRVELCSALSDGGVTPSIGLISEAMKVPDIKIHVLIRPRGGDFIYNQAETRAMLTDIAFARAAGVHGLVIGALTPAGHIDMPLCSRLMEAAGDTPVTFHRAFDLCADPMKALDDIISLGCSRILTSGQASDAMHGTETLRRFSEKAAGRVTILAGSGVTPANAADILRVSGVSELHASARSRIESQATYRRSGVAMGTPGNDEYSRLATSESIVRELSRIVHNFTP